MNYKDFQNISYLSQQILTEAASEEYDVMNRWPYASPYLQEERDGYGDDSKFKQDTDAASFRPGTTVPKVKKFGRISRAVPHGIGAHANRTASRVTTIVGDDPGAPRSQKMPTKSKMVKKNGKWHKVKEQLELWVNSLLDEGYDLSDYTWDDMYDFYLNEAKSFDLYDLVLAHLINEGYAETQEAANAIMANMSEDWVDSIVEVHGAWTRQGQSINDYSSYAQEIGPEDPETRAELRNLRRRKDHGPEIAAHARNKAKFDMERIAGRNPRTPEYRATQRAKRRKATP